MRRLFYLLSLGAVPALLTACPIFPYEPPPPPPELYDYQGLWQGTVKDSQGGEGGLDVTVAFQSEAGTLGGEWQAVFGAGTSAGIFNGSAYGYGDEVTLSLVPASATGCVLYATAVRETDVLKATYNASPSQADTCAGVAFGGGTFIVIKQTSEE